MKKLIKKISLAILMVCTYSMCYAQVEQAAREKAETEHQKFANDLPGALSNGRTSIFGLAFEKKQFFLEEDLNTFIEFLGWDKKKYNQSTLISVFAALSDKTKSGNKNPNPVTVHIDFPSIPAETLVSVKTDSKGTLATYTVTTKANVTVEVSKQGAQPSIAKNNVALIWEGKLPLVNGEVNKNKKTAAPVLRSIKISNMEVLPKSSVSSEISQPSIASEQQMQARAKELIEEYYDHLQSPVNESAILAPEIPNKTELEQWLQDHTKIEIASGNIYVPLPDNIQTLEVKNVPEVTIYVDPAPYMPEGSSRYESKEAYHQLSLTFTVDLQAEKIEKVEFKDHFVRPVLAAIIEKPVEEKIVESKPASLPEEQKATQTVQQPVQAVQQPVHVVQQPVVQPVTSRVTGVNYKIQILSLPSYKPLADLPQIYRVDGVIIEKYASGYKYVIPAGNTRQEAQAKQRELVAKGLSQAWIVVYENEVRVQPSEGKPESSIRN